MDAYKAWTKGVLTGDKKQAWVEMPVRNIEKVPNPGVNNGKFLLYNHFLNFLSVI